MKLAAAVLAGGRGERFGGDVPKPLARLCGRPLVEWAVEAALAAGIGPVAVVGGHEYAAVWHALPEGVVRLVNREWEQGIGTSVRCAVTWTHDHARAEALCLALADQPLLGPEAWRRVAAAPADALLVSATYHGERGHPVRIGRQLFPAARDLAGDEGARALMRANRVLEIVCDGTGDPVDVDTPEALAELDARLRRPSAPV